MFIAYYEQASCRPIIPILIQTSTIYKIDGPILNLFIHGSSARKITNWYFCKLFDRNHNCSLIHKQVNLLYNIVWYLSVHSFFQTFILGHCIQLLDMVCFTTTFIEEFLLTLAHWSKMTEDLKLFNEVHVNSSLKLNCQ